MPSSYAKNPRKRGKRALATEAKRTGPNLKKTKVGAGTIVIVLFLLGLLGFSVWWAIYGWTSTDVQMPTVGYVALFAGIFFSLVVGCGLMALVFYSSRKGYDEPPHIVDAEEDDEE